MRRPTAQALDAPVAAVATMHLSLHPGELPSWHPVTPRGGWTLDAAEDAALAFAQDDRRLAARAYGLLVRAAGLGRLDVVARLQGDDRARRILDRLDRLDDPTPF